MFCNSVVGVIHLEKVRTKFKILDKFVGTTTTNQHACKLTKIPGPNTVVHPRTMIYGRCHRKRNVTRAKGTQADAVRVRWGADNTSTQNCGKIFTYDPFLIYIYCIYGNDVHLVVCMSGNVSTLHALLCPVQIILDVVLPV